MYMKFKNCNIMYNTFQNIIKTLFVLISIALLSSCSFVDKTGIVKRKYRSGFYFAPIFANKQHTHEVSDSIVEKTN